MCKVNKSIEVDSTKIPDVPEKPERGAYYQHEEGDLYVGTSRGDLLCINDGNYWHKDRGFSDEHAKFKVFTGTVKITQTARG